LPTVPISTPNIPFLVDRETDGRAHVVGCMSKYATIADPTDFDIELVGEDGPSD
jgi:hypothetical protein